MKHTFFTILCLLFLHAGYSQNPYRIRVIDSITQAEIKSANVYIDQIPGSDKYSDAYGAVSYSNVPVDRRLKIHVKKEGYLPYHSIIQASRDALAENYLTVKLRKDETPTKIVIYGRVEDIEQNGIKGANIVLSCLGNNYPTVSDEFGNYRLEVNRSLFVSATSYIIEVIDPGCEKAKIIVPYNGEFISERNIQMKCKDKPLGQTPVSKSNVYNSLNLSGIWICKTVEFGKNITIIWRPFWKGTCTYDFFEEGIWLASSSGKWKYVDNILIETSKENNNDIQIGRIQWNSINDFELTILENGSEPHRNQIRHYVRY